MGEGSRQEYAWRVEPGNWAPRGRPRPPLGPTTVEVLRSCPLRACFEASGGYEVRVSFDARIGTAFHHTLEALNQYPGEVASGAELAEWVRAKFEQEIATQREEAAARPRERGLPQSEARLSAAIEALLQAAHRLAGAGIPARGAGDKPGSADVVEPPVPLPPVEVEVTVQSSDGALRGRVDRAEHENGSTHLVDFKSALRDDLPERYERQLQLYALMWRDTRGYWPASAVVVYPLTGAVHPVAIDAATCEDVAAEAIALMHEVGQTRAVASLARPGEVCRVCSYRPWCQPFWDAQAAPASPVEVMERARLGIEGDVEELDVKHHYVKAAIRWGLARVELVTPVERFPHLPQATAGSRVRLLDAELRGMRYQPRAKITERSELFLVG